MKGHGDMGQMGEGHVAKGGTIQQHGKSCFPHSTLVFMQTVSPHPLCSPLLSMLTVASLFSFFPFHPNLSAAMLTLLLPPPHLTLTQAISHRHHLDTATTAPTPWLLQPLPHHPLWGAKHPLDSPSHVSQAHTSHPTTVALTVPSAP